MKTLNRNNVSAKRYTERIVQFGEGNFLRAFVDWIIFNMNCKADFDGGVVVVQPIENGMAAALNEQDGLYHLNLQGIDKSKEINSIECIDVITRAINPYKQFDDYLRLAEIPTLRFVISNTTEAGIAFRAEDKFDDSPAKSYPGKLTQLLYRRFAAFNGDPSKGLFIFPCELIFRNGDELLCCIEKYIDHWKLGEKFQHWFHVNCGVYSTLVDRIVPGFPKDTINEIQEQIGVEDKLVVKGEIFHLWVIEAPANVAKEFPANQAGLNVLFVPDEQPYHERKVTLLNGPHTVLSPVAYLCGLDTVRQACDDEFVSKYIRRVMFDELLPTLDLPRTELEKFANDVLDRFRNPFVKHLVTSIMLNSFPKFKTRNLPGLKTYLKRRGKLPQGLVLGLAAICVYYRGGKRGDEVIIPNDDKEIIDLLARLWRTGDIQSVAKGVLASEYIWGEDLNYIEGLTALLAKYIDSILCKGMKDTVKNLCA